jgi:MYXO-CTERM domain-containing protein
MVGFARSLFIVVPIVAAVCMSTAHAELTAEQVGVRYFVTDVDGGATRLMTANEPFLNQARCECGQSIHVEVQIEAGAIDPAEPLEAFVGPRCDVGEEAPDGQFRPCAKVHVGTGADFVAGVAKDVHPVFFVNGVDPAGGRLVDDPTTVAQGSCAVGSATAGVWLCTPMVNGVAGCQAEDFVVAAHELQPVQADFTRPYDQVSEVEATRREDAIELRWSVESTGDVSGFRVLCEDAATGEPVPGTESPMSAPTSIPSGTTFFTAGDLCGDGPFATVQRPAVAGDGSCGDGVVDPGEACDDGDDNALCAVDCTLQVGAGLHALAWDHVCTGHLAFNTRAVMIDGLPPDRAYNLVLVAYDGFGNPRPVGKVLAVAPEAAGGCDCRTGPNGQGAWGLSLIVGLAALARTRRRRA